MECKKDSNLDFCTCSYPGCPNKGICCQCIQQHLASKQLPGCCFPQKAEKTYVFFNNCHVGQAARNARLMMDMLQRELGVSG